VNPVKNQLWNELISAWSRETPACQIYLAEAYTQRFPSDAFGWIILADGLTHISSFKRAASALCTALRLSLPKHRHVVYSKSAEYYREKGDLARAERWYRKAIAISESQEYLVFLGACLAKQGRYAESRYYHERAVDISPLEADEALFNLGLVCRAESDLVEALRFFEKAIEIEPEYADAKVARNDILLLLKIRSSKAADKFKKRKVSDI
jgi:tetratricopeptide (TPR) repeat protein